MDKDVIMSKLAYVFKSVSITLKQREYLYQAIKDIVNLAMTGDSGGSKEDIFEVVSSLPSVGDAKKIYLVKVPDSAKGDEYAEYVYTNGDWEQLGNLTGYEKIINVDNKLSEVKEEINVINKNVYNITVDIVKSVSSSIIEKGVNNTITINWYVTNNGVKITPDKFVIRYAGKELTNPDNRLTITLSDSTTIEFIATIGDFEKRKTSSVSAYYPMYVGSYANEITTEDELFKLNKKIVVIPINSTINATINVNDSDYIYIAVPNSTIHNITSDRFAVPFSYYKAITTAKGKYNVYRTDSTFISGTYTISIS